MKCVPITLKNKTEMNDTFKNFTASERQAFGELEALTLTIATSDNEDKCLALIKQMERLLFIAKNGRQPAQIDANFAAIYDRLMDMSAELNDVKKPLPSRVKRVMVAESENLLELACERLEVLAVHVFNPAVAQDMKTAYNKERDMLIEAVSAFIPRSPEKISFEAFKAVIEKHIRLLSLGVPYEKCVDYCQHTYNDSRLADTEAYRTRYIEVFSYFITALNNLNLERRVGAAVYTGIDINGLRAK